MPKHFILICLFCILAAQNLHAQTLIVSDVDDTIKMTDVLGKKRMVVFHGLFREKAFAGMSELYREMDKGGASLYYVSGSPKIIDFRVEEFLEENLFPQRHNLILKNKISDDTFLFKTKTIRKLIQKTNPEKIILIGDDTEYDPQVYNQIREEYPSLVVGIYIRAVQNASNVTGLFFSPVEIAGHEILEGRMQHNSLSKVAHGFIKPANGSEIALKKRYCPKEGRVEIVELKQKMREQESIDLLDRTQSKIISSCR